MDKDLGTGYAQGRGTFIGEVSSDTQVPMETQVQINETCTDAGCNQDKGTDTGKVKIKTHFRYRMSVQVQIQVVITVQVQVYEIIMGQVERYKIPVIKTQIQM